MENVNFSYSKKSGLVPSQTATMFTAAEKSTNSQTVDKPSSPAYGKCGGRPL